MDYPKCNQCGKKVYVEHETLCVRCRNLKNYQDERKGLRMYHIAKWQERIKEFSDHSEIKSLRAEIGILRVMLEEKMNSFAEADGSSTNLLLHMPLIADHIIKIEKLVKSCNGIEMQMGQYLDKGTVIQIATEIVNVIDGFIEDTTIKDKISDEILKIVERTASQPL